LGNRIFGALYSYKLCGCIAETVKRKGGGREKKKKENAIGSRSRCLHLNWGRFHLVVCKKKKGGGRGKKTNAQSQEKHGRDHRSGRVLFLLPCNLHMEGSFPKDLRREEKEKEGKKEEKDGANLVRTAPFFSSPKWLGAVVGGGGGGGKRGKKKKGKKRGEVSINSSFFSFGGDLSGQKLNDKKRRRGGGGKRGKERKSGGIPVLSFLSPLGLHVAGSRKRGKKREGGGGGEGINLLFRVNVLLPFRGGKKKGKREAQEE